MESFLRGEKYSPDDGIFNLNYDSKSCIPARMTTIGYAKTEYLYCYDHGDNS